MTAWIIVKMLHIFAGVFWTGAAALLVFFIVPSAGAAGPTAGPFMNHLNGKLKLPRVVLWAAAITVVAGYALLWKVSGGFSDAYFSNPSAHAMSLGAVTGTIAFFIAMMVQIPRSRRIAEKTVQLSENKDDKTLAEDLANERRKFTLGGRIIMVLLTITLITMVMVHPM